MTKATKNKVNNNKKTEYLFTPKQNHNTVDEHRYNNINKNNDSNYFDADNTDIDSELIRSTNNEKY